jgi:hypothetical protein
MLAHMALALTLVVRVFDNTGVTPADRASALSAAHAILQAAGIAVTWRDGAQSTDGTAPSEVLVRIVTSPPDVYPGSLGYSLVDVDHQSGTLGTVFADRVARLARLSNTDPGVLLGRAMAHEIGHLLLGSTRHADRGLMRSVWTSVELRQERPWDWALSRDDGARMRRGLMGRLRRTDTPDAVIAQATDTTQKVQRVQ